MNATTVNIRSTRHGEVALRRSEVIGAWRVKGQRLIYTGPWGESGWTPVANIRVGSENTSVQETLNKVPTRMTGPGGSLVLPYWHRTLSNSLSPARQDGRGIPAARQGSANVSTRAGRSGQKTFAHRNLGRRGCLGHYQGGSRKSANSATKIGASPCAYAGIRPRVVARFLLPLACSLKEWTVPTDSDGGKSAVTIVNKRPRPHARLPTHPRVGRTAAHLGGYRASPGGTR